VGEGEVVERSKERPPAWIELDAGHLQEDQLYLKFVEAHKYLLDLPLGIKEAQLDAMKASETAIRQKLRDKLFACAEDEGIPMNGPIGELERLLTVTAKDVHSANARIGDIYFEKLVNNRGQQPSEYYNVFVIVHFPKTSIPSLMSSLSTKLSRSRDSNFKRLGQALLKQPSGTLSH
jgi:hypothetical protein